MSPHLTNPMRWQKGYYKPRSPKGTGDLVEAPKEVSEKTRTWTYIFFSKPATLPATARCFFLTSLVGPGYPFEALMGTSGI